MNLNDIKGAVDDLIAYHGHKRTSTVYLLGEEYGINGIDEIDGKLYVLSEDGKPAVSNREYERMKARVGMLEYLLDELVGAVYEHAPYTGLYDIAERIDDEYDPS